MSAPAALMKFIKREAVRAELIGINQVQVAKCKKAWAGGEHDKRAVLHLSHIPGSLCAWWCCCRRCAAAVALRS